MTSMVSMASTPALAPVPRGWAEDIMASLRMAEAKLAVQGWSVLDDQEAGAVIMCLRAGLVEQYMLEMSAARREAGLMFPLMLMRASAGVDCRLQLDGLLPNSQPLRIAAFSSPKSAGNPASDVAWETITDLGVMGAPGWHEDADEEWMSLPVTRKELEACQQIGGLTSAQVGMAFHELRHKAPYMGMNGALLMCAILDVRERMLRMSADTVRMSLQGAHSGQKQYGDITGCIWTGQTGVPAKECDGDGDDMTLAQVKQPGVRLQGVHVVLESRHGDMLPTRVSFNGRVIH